jgi:Lon protease-like protein
MFPLGNVLFPHAMTSLHIFEPRYRALARDCTQGNGEFGIVLIERGHEVGGGDVRFKVGTVAKIVEALELSDGRWLMGALGVRRLRVNTWLPDDPYPLALVEDLEDAALLGDDVDLVSAADRAVRRALAYKAELDEAAAPATVKLDDEPSVLALQLAAIAPIGPLDRQMLLEEDDSRARIQRLIEVVEDENTVLAARLEQGGG